MTHRVGAKGQVVILKDLREELGIEPGDEVSFWRHADHVAVRPVSGRPALRGRYRGSPLTGVLGAERAAIGNDATLRTCDLLTTCLERDSPVGVDPDLSVS